MEQAGAGASGPDCSVARRVGGVAASAAECATRGHVTNWAPDSIPEPASVIGPPWGY